MKIRKSVNLCIPYFLANEKRKLLKSKKSPSIFTDTQELARVSTLFDT